LSAGELRNSFACANSSTGVHRMAMTAASKPARDERNLRLRMGTAKEWPTVRRRANRVTHSRRIRRAPLANHIVDLPLHSHVRALDSSPMLPTVSTLFVVSAQSSAHGFAVSVTERAMNGRFFSSAAPLWARR
jgi:hypothetical protein